LKKIEDFLNHSKAVKIVDFDAAKTSFCKLCFRWPEHYVFGGPKSKILRLKKNLLFFEPQILKKFEVIKISIKEIGESLKKAGNLNNSPLIIYASNDLPDGAQSMCSIDRCIAKAIVETSLKNKAPPLYIGKKNLKGCCPGAMTYLGYTPPMKYIKYFVSTGNEKFRGGEAEYMKCSPELVDEYLKSLGEIKSFQNYLVIQKSEDLNGPVDARSFLCFGKGENIRNMGSLIHFRTKDPFDAIRMPFGPACSTFITYPAGMAEKTPRETAFIGPVDPTGNIWFPEEFLALGIPINMAKKMHEDIENSFITKRPHVAYPEKREII